MFGFIKDFSHSYKFMFLFSIQEIYLLWLLYVWFVFINGSFKWTYDKIKEYFMDLLAWKWFWKFVFYSFWMFLIYVMFSWLLYWLLDYFNLHIPWFYGKQQVAGLLQWLHLKTSLDYFLIYLWVVVFWPLVEEIIYRWFIANILINRFWWFVWIVISSFIFAFVHMEWEVMWNLFILSLILSFIFYRTRSLIYTYWFHIVVNGMGFLWLLLMN
jgi:membrane protease YdiL (CAAX protease family)